MFAGGGEKLQVRIKGEWEVRCRVVKNSLTGGERAGNRLGWETGT